MAKHQPSRPLIVGSGRQPFEVLLLVACFVSAVVGAAVPEAGSRTIDEFVPFPFNIAFYVLLGVTSVVSLVGLGLQLPTNLLVERIGMLFLSALLLIYAVGLYALYGTQVGVSGAVIGSFGAAALIRAWQITHDLQKLSAALTGANVIEPTVLADPETGPDDATPTS